MLGIWESTTSTAPRSYTRSAAETVLGNALKSERDKVYLVSKAVIRPNTPKARLMSGLEESLVRLQTDYVDVYMNHAVNDVNVVKSEEWAAFIDAARQQGKIRFSGISGHAGHLVECVDYALDHNLVDVMLLAYNFGQDPGFLRKTHPQLRSGR